MKRVLFLVFMLLGVAAARETPELVESEPVAAPNAPESPSAEEAAQAAPVKIIGNEAFNDAKLRGVAAEQMAEIARRGLTRARADDAAFFIEVHYRRNGYAQVDVRWQIPTPGQLVLTIIEGPKTLIGGIRFEGNVSVPSDELREYMIGATRERFSRFKGNLPFVEADMETGASRIRGLYESQGFLNVEVEEPVFTFTPDASAADVLVEIAEGTAYQFGAVTFAGEPVFDPETLSAEIGELRVQPFTPDRLVTMERKLEYFYRTKGYFQVQVAYEANAETARAGVVPVQFIITPGEIFTFDGVTVTGLDRLRPGFLPRRFGKLHGERYDPRKLDEIFREMMQTGLFTNLRVDSTPLEGNELRIDLTVEEAKSKELGFSIGYGTYEGGIVGVRAGERNLFGTGRSLTSAIEYSQRGYRGEVLYQDNWLFETENRLRVRLYALTRAFEEYEKQEVGLRPELTRKFTKHYEAGAFALGRAVNIPTFIVVPEEMGPLNYQVVSLGLTQSYDRRDNPLNPRRGFIATTAFDVGSISFLSDVEFFRGVGRLSFYQPFGKTMLAMGARAGFISPFGESAENLPIDERFFLGGSTTVRSFTERSLGPRDRNGVSIGGEVYTVFNVEYVVPIVGDLQAAAFTDAGSLYRTVADAGSFSAGDMRYAIGLGLRYALPVGPVRLDYGFNPDRREQESTGALHFSFGFAF